MIRMIWTIFSGMRNYFICSLNNVNIILMELMYLYYCHTRSNIVLTRLYFTNNINNSPLFILFQNYKSIIVNYGIFSTKPGLNRRRMTKILVLLPLEFSYKHTSYIDNVSFNFYFIVLGNVWKTSLFFNIDVFDVQCFFSSLPLQKKKNCGSVECGNTYAYACQVKCYVMINDQLIIIIINLLINIINA